MKPYGIFVRMEGFRANALVHLSQVQMPRCPRKRHLFCRTVLVCSGAGVQRLNSLALLAT